MTSLALAEGIVRRLRAADRAGKVAPVPFRFRAHDFGLALIVLTGTVLAFTGTHGRPWQRRNPQFHFHFTPTSASWLNMVERFFRDLTVNSLRRGVFRSVNELIEAIQHHVAAPNAHPKPFVWTASASDFLEKVKRGRRKLHSMQSA